MKLFTPDRADSAPAEPATITAAVQPANVARPVAYGHVRAITASSQRIRLDQPNEAEDIRLRSGASRPWQEQTWRCFDRIGEVQFAYNLVADVISRVRIHAAVNVNPDEPPTKLTNSIKLEDTEGNDHGTPGGIPIELAVLARRLMNEFLSQSNVPEMLKTFALNILTPGECYLAYLNRKWQIYSTSELRIDPGGKMKHYPSSATQSTPRDIGRVPIGRIWQRHPRFSQDPNSGLRSAIDDCMELILLGQMIRGIARSQLNAGILFIPDGMNTAAATPGAEDYDDPDSLDNDTQQEQDPFEKDLATAIQESITDESAMATAVPTLIRGPAEEGSKILHISLSRSADQFLVERADKVLGRILNALNAPKDKVTGMAHVKYSNAKQVDEDLYKEHVEPLVLVFIDAVLDIYLRPLLLAEQRAHPDLYTPEDVDKIVVWYDPSEITTKPDRGDSANQGHDRQVISDSAWRAAHGFSATDAPDEAELVRRVALKNVPPDDVLAAMYKYAFDEFFKAARENNLAGAPLPPELQSELDSSTGVTPTTLPTPPPPAPPDPDAPDPDASAPDQVPLPAGQPA